LRVIAAERELLILPQRRLLLINADMPFLAFQVPAEASVFSVRSDASFPGSLCKKAITGFPTSTA
jgi:hypothetical protein